MGKRYSKIALLTMFLLVFQLVMPAVQTFAAADGGNTASESTMLPPSNLATQFLTPSDVKLTWSAVFGATGYNVYGIYDGELRFLGKANTNSFIANDMPEGSYSYVVSTLGPDGESGPCAPVTVEISYPEMAAPATLSGTTKNINDIVLTWTASQYAQNYNVYQVSEDGTQTKVATVTGATWTNAQAAGGSYTYAVSAAHALYGESAVSEAATVDVGEVTLAAPKNVKYTVLNGNDVRLQWDAALYANGYKIYQVIDGQKVLKQTATGTIVTLANQPAGEYSFEITTTSTRFGESAEAGGVSFTLSHPTMDAPANFKSTITNINDVTLTWQAVSYATSYKLYQVIDGEKVLKSTLTGTSTVFQKVDSGDYTYRLYSYSDRFGESAVGSEVTFNVDAPEMAAPASFTAKIVNGNDITLTWDAAANATSYKVYQIVNGQKVLKSSPTATTVTFANSAAGDYSYEIHSFSTRFGESAAGSQVAVNLVHPTMQPPEELVQSVTSATSFTLNWQAAEFANSYKVYQIINGQKTLKSTVTGTTVSYTNVAPGTYTFEVRSYSPRFGESAQGTVLTFTMNGQVMPTPGNLTYTVTNGNDITLKWDTTQYANSYKVYQIVDEQRVLKKSQTATSVVFGNMPAGEYKFVVTGVSSLLGESPIAAEVTINLVHPTLEAPGNLSHTVSNFNDIVLKWNAVQYANSYKIYEIINGEAVLQKTVTALTGTMTNVSAGEHTYEVRTFSNRFGESATGSTLTVSVEFPTLQAPANPTHSIANGNDIVLRWTAAQYATSYNIYRIVDGEKELLKTQTGVTGTLTNMPAGDYEFEIYTVSSRYGESATGSKLSLTLVHPTMQEPGGLTNTIVNGNDIALKWDAAQYATAYKIYQIIDGEKVLQRSQSAATMTFANMPAGEHTFVVHSYSDRFGESPAASELTVNLVHPIMQKPGVLTNTISNGNDITLKFGTSQYATEYRIYQIVDGVKTLKKTQSAVTATFTNMPEGKYEYAVHAYSSRFGESPEASELTFDLVHPVMQKPATFTKNIVNGNDIALAWTASQYATSYNVYQIVDGEKILQKTQTGTTLSFINMPEGEYTYEVYSYSNRFGESPVANTLTFDLVWPVVQPPVLTTTVVNANNLTLSWPAVTWANEYKVYKVDGDTKEQIYKGTARSFQIFNLKEDTFSYEVTAVSTRFGESAASNRETVTIVYPDMQAPTASVKLLSENSARISWNFITYANGYNVYEIVDGKPVLLVHNLNALSYTLTNLPYANHTYVVTSYSNSFGESDPSNSVIAQLIQDDVAPVTTAAAPHAWTNQEVVVTLSATDNDTGVAKTFYALNGGAFAEGTSVAVTEAGINELSFYSVDRVGNIEQTKSIQVKIDKTAPTTTTDAPTTWSQADVKVTLSATDAQSGVATTYYSVNGSDYTEGTTFTVAQEGINTITFYTVDAAGNQEQAQTVEVKIDKTAPTTTSDAPTTWSQADVKVTLSATDAQSGVATTYYSVNGSDYTEGTTFTVAQEGVNTITFYTVDAAGNKEQAQTVEVKIDKTAPTTTSDAPTAWSQADVKVTLSATDAQSGAATTYYSVNGSDYTEGTSFTVAQEGINTITFYTVDAAGNKEQAQTIEVKIDKTAPTTTSDAPTAWSKDDVKITLSATDATSGVATTYYSVNGSDYTEGTTFTVAQEGVNTITFYTVDAAGNKEQAQTVEVKIDKTAPTTTSDAPTTWSQADVKITLSATDATSGVATTYYSVNGSDYTEGTSFTVAQEGINTITFYTVDAAGNQEQAKTVEVKIDKTAPTTTSDAPTAWSKDDVKITLTATDATSGVAKTFYSINGSSYVEGTAFTVTKEGVNKVSFYTVDGAGNQEQAQTVDVKIDKTAPLLTINLNLEYALGTLLNLNVSATDDLSGIATQKLLVAGPGQTGKVLVNPTTLNLNQLGIYTVTATATDAAGVTTTIQKSFTVYIPASIEVTPGIIKGNNGVFTVRASLPNGFSTQGFDLNTVRLNGVQALTSNNGYYNQAKNGQFKFERNDFTWPSNSTVEVELRGYVNGELVIGKTTVKTQK
ncbi:hypothetical protein CBW65_04055 [Tumebacillus avium]|uniref:Fibronectin type-III domain-containing protein n=1 Tax=Tumebacillus avium TaxID=1903704 RepID=A0A1Y0IKH0_9BACL|nr:hypothetical protein [Tumebacillus avium]ARU60326.1 hypothetical protein CBW65_04055 [Tumebacillus avium]